MIVGSIRAAKDVATLREATAKAIESLTIEKSLEERVKALEEAARA